MATLAASESLQRAGKHVWGAAQETSYIASMDENPYQPPQSPPTGRPNRKAILGLAIMSLLSVPASAIAGSTLCSSIMVSSEVGPLAFFGGISCCLAIVIGALAIEQRATSTLAWPEFWGVLQAVADSQVRALLYVLLIGCLSSSIFHALLLRDRGQNAWLVFSIHGSILNLAWSSAAFHAWRRWFRQRAEGENPFKHVS